jgi:DNA-binding XRE family transcriptional regulator
MNADELRRWRERLGLSQAQLAEALGLRADTISRWEQGRRQITFPPLLRSALETLDSRRRAGLPVRLSPGSTATDLCRVCGGEGLNGPDGPPCASCRGSQLDHCWLCADHRMIADDIPCPRCDWMAPRPEPAGAPF